MNQPLAAVLESVRDVLGSSVTVLWRLVEEGVGVVVASTDPLLHHGSPWQPPVEDRPGRPAWAQLTTEVGQFARFLPAELRLAQPLPLAAVLCAPLGADGYRVTAGWTDAPAPAVADRMVGSDLSRLEGALRGADLSARAEAVASQLTEVLSSLGQAVALTSVDGRDGWVNAAAAALLEVPAGLVPPAALSAALTSLRGRVENPLEIEATALRLALDRAAVIEGWVWSFIDAPTHLRVATVPLQGSVGYGRAWVFDDISVEMQALTREQSTVARLEASDAALREMVLALSTSEEMLRSTLEGTLVPQALIRAVRDEAGAVVDFTFLLVNQAALADWVLPRDQLIGMRMRPLFPRFGDALLPSLASVLEGGETLVLNELELADPHRPDRRYFDVRATRVSGDRMSVSWANVTRRREASRALQASNRELAEAQRLAHAGSWTLDPETQEVSCSDEMVRIFGLASEAMPLRLAALESRMDEPTRRRFRTAIHGAETEGRASDMDYVINRPDGEQRHVRGRVERTTELPDEGPQIRGSAVDVTESHRAAEVRARRVTRHAEYLARVEHTLRTNLSVVEGWAAILEADFDTIDTELRTTALGAVRRNANALVRHVQALMSSATQDVRAEALVVEPVDVAAITAEVAADYRGLSGRVVTTTPLRGVVALASADALDTVVRHLVENAIRYTSNTGRVDVSVCAAAGHTVQIVVRDDGPGISSDVTLFSAFSKGSTSQGHGLGLHVVQTLVEAMGGQVEGRNRSDVSGAKFMVMLRQEDA